MSLEQQLAEWAQLLRELDTDSTEIQGDLFEQTTEICTQSRMHSAVTPILQHEPRDNGTGTCSKRR